MAEPFVYIILLNWNRTHDTFECLRSLDSIQYPRFTVLVIDQHSTDIPQEILRARFPSVEMIQNPENLGFAEGNNVGIRHALSQGAEYVLLLNNDTLVDPLFLTHLVATAESDARIGMVGPKIYYADAPNVIWSAGGTVNIRGDTRQLGLDEVDRGQHDILKEVDWVTGCCMLVRREVCETSGLLDARFFAYWEEVDWCRRVRAVGFRVVYVPCARLWHKIQPSVQRESRKYTYLLSRNRLLYLSSAGVDWWRIGWVMLVDFGRTLIAWSLKRRYAHLRPVRGAMVRGITDFARGRLGPPPQDL